MSRTTKSPLAVARTALEAGRRALPDFSHRNSPKTFTQPQLFACLVLRQFLKLDYRGTEVLLSEWRELRDALGLRQAPADHSTLCYAEKRLLQKGASPRRSTPPSNSPARRA